MGEEPKFRVVLAGSASTNEGAAEGGDSSCGQPRQERIKKIQVGEAVTFLRGNLVGLAKRFLAVPWRAIVLVSLVLSSASAPAALPDFHGGMFIAEKRGAVRIVRPGALEVDPVSLLRATNIATSGERLIGAGTALRFYGNIDSNVDRVRIRINNPATPADVGSTDFTVEFWMRAASGNNAGPVSPGGDNWVWGNILVDRDIAFLTPAFGDYGISTGAGRLAFGVNAGGNGHTLVGTRNVNDGVWHHVAFTRRRSDGQMRIFVDGALDAQADGPDGDVSYQDGRPCVTWPNDCFLAIGGEKHLQDPSFPSFSGWIDEFRISRVLRYTGGFLRPAAPFAADAQTAALYHFDEGTGLVVGDSSGAAGGPSAGLLVVGGMPQGPEWVTSTAPIFSNPMADVAIDFGDGVGLWGLYNQGGSLPQWRQLHGFSPSLLATGDVDGNGQVDLIVNFPGFGLWVLMNYASWTNLHAFDATDVESGDLDGNGRADLVVNFPGNGVWVYFNDVSWAPLHSLNSAALATGNVDGDPAGRADVIVHFPGWGIWTFLNNSTWIQLHNNAATDLQTGDLDGNGRDDVLAAFPGAGVWIFYNNAAWTLLHGLDPAGIAIGNIDGDAQGREDIVINFSGFGVWVWVNNSIWVQLHNLNTQGVAVGDVDGNGRADVIMHFPGFGIWLFQNYTSFSHVHSFPAQAIAADRLDPN